MKRANATITMIPVRISFEYFTESFFGGKSTKNTRISVFRDALLSAEIQSIEENSK